MSNIGKEGGWGERAEVGGHSTGVALGIFAATLVGWLLHCRHGCFGFVLWILRGVEVCDLILCADIKKHFVTTLQLSSRTSISCSLRIADCGFFELSIWLTIKITTTMIAIRRNLAAYAVVMGILLFCSSTVFAFSSAPMNLMHSSTRFFPMHQKAVIRNKNNHLTKHYANEDDSDEEEEVVGSSDQLILGISGLVASSIVLYSESALFQTGCGLPAGPFGLVGAMEGVSYLGVVGLVGFSLYTKIRTGSGLPSGPAGLLGAAEGVAFLAALAGIVVLIAQVTNYGYIPNAVPMEGGMCK